MDQGKSKLAIRSSVFHGKCSCSSSKIRTTSLQWTIQWTSDKGQYERGQPLYKGQNAGSQACPLFGVSTVDTIPMCPLFRGSTIYNSIDPTPHCKTSTLIAPLTVCVCWYYSQCDKSPGILLVEGHILREIPVPCANAEVASYFSGE